MVDDSAVGPPERLHPLYLLTGIGRALRGMTAGYAGIGYLAVSGRARIAVIGGIVALAVTAVGVIATWLRFSFRVGANEIRIDSGVFNRVHRSIPFDRIQDVDISQGPLARLLGLAQVRLETGAAGAGKTDEGVLHAIPLARASEIRDLIRAHRPGSLATAQGSAAVEEGDRVYAMRPARVVLAGLFNFSLALFAGLFGLTQTMGDVLGFDPLNRRFWRQLLSAGSPIADYVLAHRVVAAIAGLVLLALAGALTGIVRTALRDFGFRLDKVAAGLRRRRGLFTRTDVTLPIARAQAAILATGPVRAAFGWREVKLQSLASDDGKGDHVLAPLAGEAEAAAVVAALGWRPLPASPGWQPVDKAHVTTLAVGLAPLLLAAAAIAVIDPLVALIPAAAYAIAVAGRWLAWRHTAWTLDGDRLLVRLGWWRQRTILLPLKRMQTLDLTESSFSRRFGIATLVFGVAGGGGFSAHRLPALPRETARTLRWHLLA